MANEKTKSHESGVSAKPGSSPDHPKTKTKTTKSGVTRTVSAEKPAPEQRQKRAKAVASKSMARRSQASRRNASHDKGLVDLLEHALRDMYYAERKVYRALPKMIKAADDDELAAALAAHRDETQGHIEELEHCFETMGLRPKGEKCDAIDGIIEEAEGILEDFAETLAGDAAIIFSARAVEHYEIARYSSMVGFADALGLDDVQARLQSILDQEKAAESNLMQLAEGSINEAACEYDADDDDPAPDANADARVKASTGKSSKQV